MRIGAQPTAPCKKCGKTPFIKAHRDSDYCLDCDREAAKAKCDATDIVERWTRRVEYGHYDASKKPAWVDAFFEKHHQAATISGDYPWAVGDTLALHQDGSVTVERATIDQKGHDT